VDTISSSAGVGLTGIILMAVLNPLCVILFIIIAIIMWRRKRSPHRFSDPNTAEAQPPPPVTRQSSEQRTSKRKITAPAIVKSKKKYNAVNNFGVAFDQNVKHRKTMEVPILRCKNEKNYYY
jgi:uncharacterized membrane protein YfcA